MQKEMLKILLSQHCMSILQILQEHEYNVSTISEKLSLSKPMISYYLRQLESAGLVRIYHSVEDLRVKKVHLSEKGSTFMTMYENGMLLNPIFSSE